MESVTANLPLDSLAQYGKQIEKLGEGTYGTVYKHYDSINNRNVAIKEMTCRLDLTSSVIREISSLSALQNSQDVIRMYGFYVPQDLFINPKVSLVMELGKRSLADAIKTRVFSLDEIKEIMYQLVRGTHYMNKLDIWHRDLKPGNVIITSENPIKVKIADFGLSRSGPFCYITPSEVAYTLWYRAPEILINQILKKEMNNYNDKAEIWALGICFWDLLADRENVDSNDEDEPGFFLRDILYKTEVGQLHIILDSLGWDGIDESTHKKLIQKHEFFKEIPSNRTNSEMLKVIGLSPKSEEWKLLLQMLTIDPKKRSDTTQILESEYFGRLKNEKDITSVSKRKLYNINKDWEKRLPSLGAYTRVTKKMYEFAGERIPSFLLATDVLCRVIRDTTDLSQITEYRQLLALGLCCCTLSSKYYDQRSFDVEDIEGFDPATLTELEASIFRSHLFGTLNQRTAYRVLVENLGCPLKGTPEGDIFELATEYLIAIQQIAEYAFENSPDENALIAIELAQKDANENEVLMNISDDETLIDILLKRVKKTADTNISVKKKSSTIK